MRKEETLALTWEDINLKDNEISITRALGQGKSQRLYVKHTKTDTECMIKMDEATNGYFKRVEEKAAASLFSAWL